MSSFKLNQKKQRTRDEKIEGSKSWIKNYSVSILIFLFSLFILLLISRPALYINDEFITVNQLHQLNNGHQTLINECKYGCFQNGTPSEYFLKKDNILGYTLFLPALSLPAIRFFSLAGDQFRLPIIIGWSIIPLLFLMVYSASFPSNARFARIPLIYYGAIISIVLLMINLYYYHPFPYSKPDAPIESAAVILTNTILGALMGVTIYKTALQIFQTRRVAIFCAISIMCCSSFLFWSGTAKDHILMTFLVSLVTFFFISSFFTNEEKYQYLGFFSIGLLAWVRPEIGSSFFVGAFIFLIWDVFFYTWIREITVQKIKTVLTHSGFFVLGIIPLFINNLITTHNIFIPPFYYYYSDVVQGSTSVESINSAAIPALSFPSLLSNYFWSTSPIDIFFSLISVLFLPKSGNMSLFAVTPLFFTGGILFLGIIVYSRPNFSKNDIRSLTLIILFIFCAIAAYVRSLPGISISGGIVPDMRYFLPLYLLGGLIGFYPLARWGKEIVLRVSHLRYFLLIFFISTATTLLIALLLPQASYNEYSCVYMTLSYLISVLFILVFIMYYFNKCSPIWTALILIFLISIPLSWQILMEIFYSVGKLHGYPFWMPYLEYLIEKYLHYNIIS